MVRLNEYCACKPCGIHHLVYKSLQVYSLSEISMYVTLQAALCYIFCNPSMGRIIGMSGEINRRASHSQTYQVVTMLALYFTWREGHVSSPAQCILDSGPIHPMM